MICPACKGLGFTTGFGCPGFVPMKPPCQYCVNGVLDESKWTYDPERGKRLWEEACAYGKTQRQVAKERGVSVVVISNEYRGFFSK